MSRRGLHVRGIHAGQAADLLHKEDETEDKEKLRRKIRRDTQQDSNRFKANHCFEIHVKNAEDETQLETVWCCDIHSIFQQMSKVSPDFSEVLLKAMSSDEIHVTLYVDGVTPGNPLQPDPSRQVHLFYVTPGFASASRSEWSWITICAVRQRRLRDMAGGLAAVLHALLEAQQSRSEPKMIHLQSQNFLVKYKITKVVADESAIHALLGCKGSSGRRPCYRCQTLVSKYCAEQQLKDVDLRDHFHALWHSRIDDIVQNSDEDIWQALDFLISQAERLSKGRYEELEKNVGWTASKSNVQTDPSLRAILPPSCFRFDPFHCYFSQGILAVEVKLLVTQLAQQGYDLKSLKQDILEASKKFKSLHAVCVISLADRYFSESTWKANGATQIALWPLMHYVLITRLTKEVREALAGALQTFFCCVKSWSTSESWRIALNKDNRLCWKTCNEGTWMPLRGLGDHRLASRSTICECIWQTIFSKTIACMIA